MADATTYFAVPRVTYPRSAIIPLLRQVRPSCEVASTLKWEGIVNDPNGAIPAVPVFEALVAGQRVKGSNRNA